jgi:predicted extracellular nuclease
MTVLWRRLFCDQVFHCDCEFIRYPIEQMDLAEVGVMRRVIIGAACAAVLAGVGVVHTQAGTPTELFISEYLEGISNNRAIEIYNGTGAPVSVDNYNVQIFFNGSTTAGLTLNLAGTVADGDVYVIAHAAAAPDIIARADQTNSSGWFSGDDAVVLRRGTVVIDVIGQIGVDPGTEWGTGVTSTADNTLQRLPAVCAGDVDGSDAFDPLVQWEGFANNTFTNLGSHTATCVTTTDEAPVVTSITPAAGASGVTLNADLTVTFSEPVNVTGAPFSLSCAVSGTHPAVVSGGPSAFTLNPSTDFVFNETCTLVVNATAVTDQDSNDPPDVMTASVTSTFTTDADPCTLPFTPIPAIQGAGAAAALTGTVTTRGVVVGDFEGPSPALRGFYIQDPSGDGNVATSDAIFVFNGNNDNVSLGDLVRVSGNVGEFEGQTQISGVTAIRRCGAASVSPVDVTLPFADAAEPERYEGMLVRLPQTLHATEHFQLGRFGQVVLASGGRLLQPTSVRRPGGEALALQAANALNRIILDDGRNDQNSDPIVFARGGQPLSATNTLRGGDTASGIVGVMTYTWGGNAASPNAYRVRPIGALGGTVRFEPANPRPSGPPDVGGTLRVAGMNLLNYFNTFNGASSNPPSACNLGVGGGPTDCRGADDPGEFARQWPKTVAAIRATDADVIGVVEIENDGYGPGSALADLVGRLNAASAPGTYAYMNVDAEVGKLNALGADAIKVGLVFKPASVTPIGVTAVLNTGAFVTGGDGGARNRPALAQAFQTPTGGRFVAVVNHLKSKGTACDAPDAGDGQGHCSAVRRTAARELAAWLATDPTGTGDAGILVLGDLNSYAQEDPIAELESVGFVNLVEQVSGATAYSYAFDGQWGYLDHALASPALGPQVTGVAEFHINADEPSVLDYNDDFKSAGQLVSLYAPDPFRGADHDPIIVGLDLSPALSGHVTGGGWLTLADGSRRRGRVQADKADFELAARYVAGATTPVGQVRVRFGRAGFSFASAALHWLTVSGGQAVLEGTGTVNGAAGYTVRVTAVDGLLAGGLDRLRIQVWSTTTGDVVFDTGAVAEIGRGSIVMHGSSARP